MDQVIIVIPAYNEEAEIGNVARAWHAVADETGGASRVLVVDDGSRDGTAGVLRDLAAGCPRLLVETQPNAGHGAAVLNGYRSALRRIDALQATGDRWWVFQTDSDGQTDPAEFRKFWERRNDADVLIGHRIGRQDGFSRVVVTKTLKLVLRCVFGIGIADANTPFRLMRAETLAAEIGRVPDGFNLSNVLLSVLFARNPSVRMLFLPITFKPRQSGVNSINLRKISKIGLRAVRDFARIRRELDAGNGK